MDISVFNNKWHLVSPIHKITNKQTVQIYGRQYVYFEGKLTLDRCPHRSSKLSEGYQVNNQLQCSLHKKYFCPYSSPEIFYGTIKDGFLWIGGMEEDEEKIPRIPEFDDESYHSVYFKRELEGVNALSYSEITLDYQHLETVHLYKILQVLQPQQQLNKKENKFNVKFETERVRLRLEISFFLPFGNCLKFYVHDKKYNKVFEPFILFMYFLPNNKRKTTVTVRQMRKSILKDYDFLFDFIYIAFTDIPLWEDARAVRTIETKYQEQDELNYPEDEFIQHYRQQMRLKCPQLLNYLIQ